MSTNKWLKILWFLICGRATESNKSQPVPRSRDYDVEEIRRYIKKQRVQRQRLAAEKPKRESSRKRRIAPLDTNLHRATKTSPQQKSVDVWWYYTCVFTIAVLRTYVVLAVESCHFIRLSGCRDLVYLITNVRLIDQILPLLDSPKILVSWDSPVSQNFDGIYMLKLLHGPTHPVAVFPITASCGRNILATSCHIRSISRQFSAATWWLAPSFSALTLLVGSSDL